MPVAAADNHAIPTRHALFASAASKGGKAPAGFVLFAEAPALLTPAQSKRALYAGIAVALILHVALLMPMIARLGSAPPLGLEEGTPDTLNVSVISEADLKRLGSDPIRQEGQPSPLWETR